MVPSSGGAAPVEAFADHIDDRTRLVSVAWVSNQNGYQQDLAGLAELAHDRGTYLYADAVQGIGMLDLDVKEVGIDFFTTGTYKWLLAGHGVAPFYVREELLDLVAPDRYGHLHVAEDLGDYQYRLHDDARKYEYATLGLRSGLHAERGARLSAPDRREEHRAAHGGTGAPPSGRAYGPGAGRPDPARQPFLHRRLRPRPRRRDGAARP